MQKSKTLTLVYSDARYLKKCGLGRKFKQCCGSGMFIPDPGSKNSKKKRGEIKNLSYLFV
jgi:hypothetical protein